jgi:4-hydroxyproline epimerase
MCIRVIDSHTGGEPTRVIVSGAPVLRGSTLADRVTELRDGFDYLRTASILEPRGSEALVGALLCPPINPDCTAGVIYFNNAGYLGMCGHGTIGLLVTLAHLNRLEAGVHRIETPVGIVSAELHDEATVTVENVPAYRFQKEAQVEVPGWGTITGDVAWGGNWFFITDYCPYPLATSHVPELTAYTKAIRRSLSQSGIRGAGDVEIDHIEVCGKPGLSRAHAKNFVLCPGGAFDRSPCGTGTSAKLACLAADGKLAPGEVWVQESIIGSTFQASYSVREEDGTVLPRLTGTAYVTAETTLVLNTRDPFQMGIQPV